MSKKNQLNFAIFIDIESRDGAICRALCNELIEMGYSAKCFTLKEEAAVYKNFVIDVSVINKPHFQIPFRFIQKLKGVKFVVLDTEGVLPGQNRQHVLVEPDGYVHWFKHQAERYNFKVSKTIICGYPRQKFLRQIQNANKGLFSIATNFSVLGYAKNEVLNRQKDRQLKLTNDWSLTDYKDFQEECLITLKKIIIQNPDKQFIIKPHPNDPKSLWDSFQSSENVDIMIGNNRIDVLFDKAPSYHLCMDGCTTILDAYLSNVPCISFGHFSPFKESLLRELVEGELRNDNLLLTDGQISVNKKHKSIAQIQQFKSELETFDFLEIIRLLVSVKEAGSKFRFYDKPTSYHYLYWLKYLIKKILRTRLTENNRVKFHGQ